MYAMRPKDGNAGAETELNLCDTSIISDAGSRTLPAYPAAESPYIVRCPREIYVSSTGEMTSRHRVTDTRRAADKWSPTTHTYFLSKYSGAPGADICPRHLPQKINKANLSVPGYD